MGAGTALRHRRRATGGTSAARRFTRRRSRARRRPLRVAAWVVTVLVVAGGVGWMVFYSPFLTAQRVMVMGVAGSEAQAVQRSAAVPLGGPLALVDVDGIRRRVAARLPIAAASVERRWPHTVVVRAVPRTPALAVRNAQGQLQVVDAAGVAYAVVPAVPPGIPLATAESESALSPPALRAALTVIDALPDGLRSRASSLTVSSAELVQFRLGRTAVVWGGADDSALKARIVAALLPTKPASIDVSAPETPVTRAAPG
jgi:cell division protein FtsQ